MESDVRVAAEHDASVSELRLVIGQLQTFSEQLRGTAGLHVGGTSGNRSRPDQAR